MVATKFIVCVIENRTFVAEDSLQENKADAEEKCWLQIQENWPQARIKCIKAVPEILSAQSKCIFNGFAKNTNGSQNKTLRYSSTEIYLSCVSVSQNQYVDVYSSFLDWQRVTLLLHETFFSFLRYLHKKINFVFASESVSCVTPHISASNPFNGVLMLAVSECSLNVYLYLII